MLAREPVDQQFSALPLYHGCSLYEEVLTYIARLSCKTRITNTISYDVENYITEAMNTIQTEGVWNRNTSDLTGAPNIVIKEFAVNSYQMVLWDILGK